MENGFCGCVRGLRSPPSGKSEGIPSTDLGAEVINGGDEGIGDGGIVFVDVGEEKKMVGSRWGNKGKKKRRQRGNKSQFKETVEKKRLPRGK